jgi:hypothetical protein
MSETVEQITKQELDALKMGSAMLYAALNRIYGMHYLEEVAAEDKTVELCGHCSDIAGEERAVVYPCPTVSLLLEYFVVAPESSNEETPAE